MKIPVSIFARVSSDEQDFNRQILDLKKIAAANNFEVVSIISEKVSGAKSNDERIGIQQLLAEARQGKFQKVLCAEVSRLGRSTIQTLKLIEELHQLGISIYLQDLKTETLDEKGEISFQTEMMLHMLSLFAKNERRNLTDRIRSGMSQARLKNIHCGRPKESIEDNSTFLSKYPKVVDGLKRGFSIRECVKLYDTSLGTVAKIRKMIVV
ncbi:recombinase family protein [Flavobacterium sp.]|jgi:DNA invertase Pin-like site-specific DNA recombinase|uniref:recombinase family protein n=1 Tax=Flavobacterium sp. TaxID=239 RepID=UPI0022BD481C|nr:recombinase family protein [Flavobacterium sp.]MCZ8168257.1 recombinase family protein [Flavobacterium sp.]MCZ8295996.1 recombinase family protein [Flavobacterium sp.]